jgi:hypothetical protein
MMFGLGVFVRAARRRIPVSADYLAWTKQFFHKVFQNQPGWLAEDACLYNLSFGGPDIAGNDLGKTPPYNTEYAQMMNMPAGTNRPASYGDGFSNFPYTNPDDGKVATQTGIDYVRRAINVFSQLHDMEQDFGLSTAATEAVFAEIATWDKFKSASENANFQSDFANAVVIYGTSKVGPPAPVVAPVVTSDQTFTVSKSLGADQFVMDIAYTGGAPTGGTVGSPYTDVLDIRQGYKLFTKVALSGQTDDTPSVPVSLSNSAGASPVVNVDGTLTGAQSGGLFGTTGTTFGPVGGLVKPAGFTPAGKVMRIKHVDTNAETDIDWSGNSADAAAALAFAGGAQVRIVGLYDWLTGALIPAAGAGPKLVWANFEPQKMMSGNRMAIACTEGAFAPTVTAVGGNLGGLMLGRADSGYNDVGRAFSFISSGQSNDYDNDASANLVGVNSGRNVVTERSYSGVRPDRATTGTLALDAYAVVGASYRGSDLTLLLRDADGAEARTFTQPANTAFGASGLLGLGGFPNDQARWPGQAAVFVGIKATTPADLLLMRDGLFALA